ncbi:10493_t:CDS:1 [Funneliformis geosporum]|uniref:17813_t:CDS:1 n=1 Tax=Funneliformis geosporum TaxID=1117311 RepID=A0A9W4WTU7_9GLOM|nr:10493_t:CDS:1 [Funneliformis geosporum]CAI2171732.1 17813_t:CDS:1 [Funneliformis geosporum]
MGKCFLIRRIYDLLNYKSTTTTELHKQFFEVECDQVLFNDLGIHGNDINEEKSILRGFPLGGSLELTTKLSSLPTECLTLIFQNVGFSGLFSCLLVCRAWCRKVVPILWSKPFDKLPKDNRYKLIRTYITSLSTEEKSFLNLQLKKHGFSIPNTTISLFNYPIYLKELSYVELYQAVDSGIKYYRKSFIGRNTYKLTFLITKSLCKMFLTKNINDSSYHLQSFKIDKYFIQINDIFPEIDLFSKVYPGLSQITKFSLNYYNPISDNLFKLLQYFPSLCKGLCYLDITLPYFENNTIIIDLLISIIKAQRSLQEFNLSGARIGANFIIPNLFSFHCNSLVSVKFKNVNFHKVNLHLITSCKRLENLTIYHCTGLTRSSLPSANNLLNDNSTYFFDYNGMRLKSLNIGCSPKCSQIPKIILESPLTETCQELCLDLITPEIINATRRNCQNVTTLKLRDYFIINDVIKESSSKISSSLLFNLFHGLLLEKLIISISPKNSDYDELNVRAIDLPPSCWYLELRCGFSERQLYELLLSKDCVAPISLLILDYLKLNIFHLMTVRDFAMVKGTLKYFEIGGRKDFDKSELKVIKDLQNEYNVTVIFQEN